MRRRERGSATLEILGLVPLVVVAAIALVQVCAFAYTVSGANQASRDGARALSTGSGYVQVAQAVDRSLPGSLRASTVRVESGERVVVRVPVPRVGPFPAMTVERAATMPRTSS
ncbi:TadE/TadG family type IV pilus assembly protein [Xylanimonas oleitrophica]|uniref:TadE/TadG family type IV pilus assembly protein n=1 Tax=Xylanimonas oleitrophica TaxID=2607479 RepID=UPI0015CFBBA2|nr:TadE family protein [Xylanimonas oleitrophica]